MRKIIYIIVLLINITTVGFCQKIKNSSVLKTDSKIIYDICFTSMGGSLAIADDNNIKLYATDSKALVGEFKNGHSSQIRAIDISKDSSLLVSGDKDGVIIVWDFINKKILKKLTFEKGIVTSVKISSDDRYLVSGGTDNIVYLYDLLKDKLLHKFVSHTEDVTAVDISSDCNLLASASGDKTIKVYDISTYKLIANLAGHTNWVRGISFSKEGNKLISCGDDRNIIMWEIEKNHKISIQDKIKYHYNWILCVDINQDNKTYVFSGMDGIARIVTPFGMHYQKIGGIANKIKFKPNEGNFLTFAIATSGNGVIYTDSQDMKFKN